MKKLLLVTAITILGLAQVNAQDVQFGAKLGLNFASVTGDVNSSFDPVTSFNYGLVAEVPLSRNFSFQPEVLYSGQGFSFDSDESSLVQLDYLTVPLMGKYYLTKGLSLEAGPQVGFLVSAKQDDVNLKDNYKGLDFGVNFGVGYKFDSGLNFAARYNVGLSDVNDVDSFSDKYKNGVMQVSIGYFFF
ncbi:porin family protein [Algibacter sp. L4_22]|uniref:porin family protein n=1 Tax=Algibacter sp. L4_22 TaxID=2942477 RepID=UPI00201B860F|nr:porin family protein [Algibacter sp. L4_22]MCL5128916.1 PorT family protein [Algibacter sp. L4_22]